MKRRLLAIFLGTVMAMSFAGCGSGDSGQETANEGSDSGEDAKPFEGQTVRVSAWGGTYEETLRNIVKPAFEERTGATLEIVLGSAPIAQLKAEGDDPSVDVLHVN